MHESLEDSNYFPSFRAEQELFFNFMLCFIGLELKCFHDHEEKSVPDHSGRTSLVFDTRLLWNQDELQVYFMNPSQYAKFDQIIPLMNVWRGGNKNSSVPKFVESRRINQSDIRIEFSG